MSDKSRRASPRAFLTNLEAPMPWPKKIRLLVRNLSLRIIRHQACCGHAGEPGC